MADLLIDGRLDAERLRGLVAELEAEIAAGLELGGQLYVELGGEVVADAAFGEARPGQSLRRSDLMLWMSSTKPVAALAIAVLWEGGQLELDDPVVRFVPEFAAGGKERITLRHLLTHTGGIRMLDTGWPGLGWDGIVARICAQKPEPRWEPGRKAGYHLASSWFVLGEVVRRIDGRPFEEWVRDELFLPLGAGDCWIGMPPEVRQALDGRIAPMFDAADSGLTENRATAGERLVVCSPGGNGCGPIGQFAKVYRMLAAHGELEGRRYLRPQTVEALTARHRVGMVDATFRTRLDWGLGFIVNSAHYGEENVPYGYGPHAGPRTWGHSGARSSTLFHDPDARLIFALAVNGMPDDEAHRRRFERLTTAVYADLGLVDC
ncbi:MAG: serine hydrolase domain-containing protein [Thermoanaerobaculia bacterium]